MFRVVNTLGDHYRAVLSVVQSIRQNLLKRMDLVRVHKSVAERFGIKTLSRGTVLDYTIARQIFYSYPSRRGIPPLERKVSKASLTVVYQPIPDWRERISEERENFLLWFERVFRLIPEGELEDLAQGLPRWTETIWLFLYPDDDTAHGLLWDLLSIVRYEPHHGSKEEFLAQAQRILRWLEDAISSGGDGIYEWLNIYFILNVWSFLAKEGLEPFSTLTDARLSYDLMNLTSLPENWRFYDYLGMVELFPTSPVPWAWILELRIRPDTDLSYLNIPFYIWNTSKGPFAITFNMLKNPVVTFHHRLGTRR